MLPWNEDLLAMKKLSSSTRRKRLKNTNKKV